MHEFWKSGAKKSSFLGDAPGDGEKLETELHLEEPPARPGALVELGAKEKGFMNVDFNPRRRRADPRRRAPPPPPRIPPLSPNRFPPHIVVMWPQTEPTKPKSLSMFVLVGDRGGQQDVLMEHILDDADVGDKVFSDIAIGVVFSDIVLETRYVLPFFLCADSVTIFSPTYHSRDTSAIA